MQLIDIKYKLKLFGALLGIVGTVTAVWFGSTFESTAQPIVAGERSLCAFGMVVGALLSGSLSLAWSYEFDGSKLWDWAAMIALAAAVILLGLALGDSAIVGASIGDALAVIGGGIVGVMTPHNPNVGKHQPHPHFDKEIAQDL